MDKQYYNSHPFKILQFSIYFFLRNLIHKMIIFLGDTYISLEDVL